MRSQRSGRQPSPAGRDASRMIGQAGADVMHGGVLENGGMQDASMHALPKQVTAK